MLVCALGTPDYTGGTTGWVESGVRFVAFVRVAELSMDLGVHLRGGVSGVLNTAFQTPAPSILNHSSFAEVLELRGGALCLLVSHNVHIVEMQGPQEWKELDIPRWSLDHEY